MKIIRHNIEPDGVPVPGSGKLIEADTARGIVEIMRYETPFTADQPLDIFMEQTLARIDKTHPPLPNDPEPAATEFLARLAASTIISFK